MLTTSSGAAEDSHVRARLVADATELRAGASFKLGVLLESEPGWNVYWRNPGEAGLATEIDYELPAGFSVGELRWPTPISFEQSDGVGGFGYEDPVVLAAEVTAPDRVGASAPIKVTASWLACKDVCILGSAELEAELPLRGVDLEASINVFGTWSEDLPTPAESGFFDLTVTGGPVPESGSVDLAVWLNWEAVPGVIEFFPDPGPGLKVESVRTQTRGNLTRIDFTLSRLKTSGAPAKSLRSLIVIENEHGKRSAWITHIELD